MIGTFQLIYINIYEEIDYDDKELDYIMDKLQFIQLNTNIDLDKYNENIYNIAKAIILTTIQKPQRQEYTIDAAIDNFQYGML